MLSRVWDIFVDTLIAIFVPMVCIYNAICSNLFLNVAAQDATGLEKMGNILLSPTQYLFAGRDAILKEDGSWQFVQKFDYNHAFWTKSLASITSLPASLVLGSAVKGLSFLTKETRDRYSSMLAQRLSDEVRPNFELYQELGMGDLRQSPLLIPEGYQRRPGDENYMHDAKEALRDISKILTEAQIPWWVDCGTLLGAYRYGGIIPWDNDIDISVLEPDFENVRRALNRLNKEKYIVQDWSGRDNPDTYFKIYVKSTGHLIDVDFYSIDREKKELSCIFSLENNIFFFEWFKIGERRFKKPVSFDVVFPLKKTTFDGIEVLVPNQSKIFLQRYYGENLAPAKIYNPKTGVFEKDLSHPYWKDPYVH